MSSEPIDIYISRWVLNSTCGRILKAKGYPVAGKPGSAVIVSGPQKKQIILDGWHDSEEDARRTARAEIKDSIRTTERELVRKKTLLDALETDPNFVLDQTSEDVQAAE